MKKTGLIIGIFTLLMFAFSSTISAQEKGMKDRREDGKKRFEKMKERLKLTDAQIVKVEEINKKYAALVDEARAKDYAEQKDKMKAVRDIRREQDKEVSAILDDTQKAEWAKMKEEKKSKMKERRGKRKDRDDG